MQQSNYRRYLYYTSLILIVLGLPFSKALISFGQVGMAILFLFDMNLMAKLKSFFHNKAAIAFSSIYFLSILGLLNTDNFSGALMDIQIKLPILLFPLVFATEPPLAYKEIKAFALLFSAAVTASITFSFGFYLFQDLADFRDAFLFVSHIRLSLQVLLAMSFLLFYAYDNDLRFTTKFRYFFLIVAALLFVEMLFLELLTGMVVFLVAGAFFILRFVIRKKGSSMLWLTFVIGVMLLFGFGWSIYNIVYQYSTPEKVVLSNLDSHTRLGNPYQHRPLDYNVENGSYIGLYIQQDEMRKLWNSRSSFDFDGNDERNQAIQQTLLRYLNSKHLRKDAEGVNSLTKEDIRFVEMGIANVEYTKKFSLEKRIYKLLWEYDLYKKGHYDYGHTLIQRIELWQTAFSIFKQNPIYGIGTGDSKDEFQKMFISKNSPLVNSKLKAHNQFLGVMVNFGLIGLLVFLFALFYPPSILKIWNLPIFFYFFSIMLISMLWEDTIETQVGASLFAFFFSFFMFSKNFKKEILK
jgi:hypothetical protein